MAKLCSMDRRWEGQTVAVVAGGASLKDADLSILEGTPTIAINNSWKLVRFAEILYAADGFWWQHHKGVCEFKGERWTQDRGAPKGWPVVARTMGIRVIQSKPTRGLSFEPSVINTGYPGANSAFQALNLAVLAGARRVLLLGCDMFGRHWFGDHPPNVRRPSPYGKFCQTFELVAPQLNRVGVEVINCSAISKIQAYPKMTLQEALTR